MRVGALVEASIYVISEVIANKKITKRILNDYVKKNKYIGSKDRKLLYEFTFNTLKKYFSLAELCEKNFITTNVRNITLLNIFNRYRNYSFQNYYEGNYALRERSNDKLIYKIASEITKEIKPKFPSWIEKKVQISQKSLDQIYSSIVLEPRFDIAVNKSKYDRNIVKQKLKKLHIKCRNTKISPYGITIEKRIPKQFLLKFKEDIFEIQDEGSQLITQIINLRKNCKILDFCAGKGTKTILINNILKNEGEIYAYDISKKRLDILEKRVNNLQLKKVKIIQDLKKYKDYFDIVICDVPCSGSGTWRRRPENIIHLSAKKLSEFKDTQMCILDNAANLCKKNGELVYITCSLIEDENKQQILAFLKKYNNFKLVSIKERIKKYFADIHYNDNEYFFTLTPDYIQSDGYYLSVVKKIFD